MARAAQTRGQAATRLYGGYGPETGAGAAAWHWYGLLLTARGFMAARPPYPLAFSA